MNKFSKILESVVLDSEIVESIGKLDSFKFITYTLGMRKIVEKYLEPYFTEVNFNNEKKYQLPLSLLYSTGNFPEIKKYGSGYWSHKLKISLVIVNGNWHPINKLNTNSFDQAEIVVELVKREGLIEDLKNVSKNQNELKNWLISFFNNNDILSLIKKHKLKLSGFIKYNRKLSEIGDKAETEVASHLESKGYNVLYRGGDGDPIDMAFGCDLIVSKDDKVFTVQIKRTRKQCMKAASSGYKSIDLFYWSDGKNIGSIDKPQKLF